MFNKRQLDTQGVFQFLNKELSIPCIAYNTALVRVFNALPAEVKLDVYLDDELLAKELAYKEFSYYIPVFEAEIHSIKVFISDMGDAPILDTQVQIHQANVETLTIVGSLEKSSISTVLGEPTQQLYPNKAVIRYANLSNNDIIINVLRNNIIIQSGPLNITEYNKYSVIDEGIYTFQFILNDKSGNISQTSVTHILKPTRIYTFYLVGSLDPNSPIYSSHSLELVISVDIATIIKQCPPDMKKL